MTAGPTPGPRIVMGCAPGERRIAVLDAAGTMIDYAVDRPGAPDGMGDLHVGRIVAAVPAMAGAFVRLDGQPDGFLPDSAGAAGLTHGQAVAVRIARAAQGGKGPRLAAVPALAGAAFGLVARGPDGLHAMAASHPGAAVETDDPGAAALARDLAATYRPHAFRDLAARADALADPVVALSGGGSLTIEPTRALIAVDVDTAGATAARRSRADAMDRANRDAIAALAREMRLRALGGTILVDFAGLSPRRRQALAPDIVAALAADPAGPRLLGFTRMGLAEILRPRGRAPLHERLAGPHAAGLAALRVLLREGGTAGGLALLAAPAIVSALLADGAALSEYARAAGRAPVLRADPSLAPAGWRMVSA